MKKIVKKNISGAIRSPLFSMRLKINPRHTELTILARSKVIGIYAE